MSTRLLKGTLNTAKWVQQHVDLLLKHRDPETGEVTLDYSRATPRAMAPIVYGLRQKTEHVNEMLDEMPDGPGKERIIAELQAWAVHLNRYIDLTTEALKTTPLSPKSIWWCVTMPLTLGWYPNEDCTNVDPEQAYQRTADIATPLIIINQAVRAGAFYDTQNFGKYWDFAVDEAKAAGVTAAGYIDDASDWAAEAFDNLNAYVDVQRKIVPWVAGAIIVGGLAYLAFRSGPRKRT